MRGRRPSYIVLLLFAIGLFSGISLAARSTKAKDAVRLDSIQALTFRKDKLTTHRRVSALPQLNCIGGSAQGLFTPDTVRCTNAGSSYSTADIEWTCTASLPSEFKLGSTDVVCEGYDSAEDDFILKGSCGLEYRLILTDIGEEMYGKPNWWGGRSGGTGGKASARVGTDPRTSQVGEGVASLLFWLIFGGVALFIVYSAWNNSNTPGPRRAPRRNYGGRGDDGDDDPPPPYSPNPRPPRKQSSKSSSSGAGAGWQPGFWSGTAAGAAAGYFAGSRGQNRQQQRPASSSWFGGGARNDPGEGPSRSAGRSSGWGSGGSSAPSPSSQRHESTGFGGTRRR